MLLLLLAHRHIASKCRFGSHAISTLEEALVLLELLLVLLVLVARALAP